MRCLGISDILKEQEKLYETIAIDKAAFVTAKTASDIATASGSYSASTWADIGTGTITKIDSIGDNAICYDHANGVYRLVDERILTPPPAPAPEDNEIHINIKKKKFNFNFND